MHKVNRDIKQNSEEWIAAKLGKPSASNASRVVTSVGLRSKSLEGLAQDLAGETFAGKSLNQWSGNASTQYGHDTEDEGINSYMFKYDCEVEQVGFIEDDLSRYLVSPDGLVGDKGMVEIKCKPKLHLKTLLDYKETGKMEVTYVAQLQMQLLISEREWVDLYYFHPDLPCLKFRVKPDEVIQRGLKMYLAECLAEKDRILQILREF